jgi:hypothetical protein
MTGGSKKNNSSHEQKLDVLGNITTFFLCLLMIIWTSFQIFYLLKDNSHNIILYIVYYSLIIFCLGSLISLGKKLLEDFFKWRCR